MDLLVSSPLQPLDDSRRDAPGACAPTRSDHLCVAQALHLRLIETERAVDLLIVLPGHGRRAVHAAGGVGELRVDDTVLGYVVLPEHMDLSEPVEIYWNDLQITATLTP